MATKIEKLREKYEKYKEEHIEVFDPDYHCVICKKALKTRKDVVAIGNGISRHENCRPGSPKWLKYQKGDKYYQYYEGVTNV